ncbi:MAG: peptidase M10A and M12B matrixin and adamalysin [Methylomonas sp.]|nr:MAG: peptidase M10A and M12B matrixin and adamalysin [Methylomonas sp.]PPD24701.1 MAG: peptidase M10A and M12B matrixin and adamalysin [Methylomonas sp.]PPD33234.1 MAG: peptidase M10A and M12B matrixin and adamalysin [Methylomonas sp.]PPD41181.1 MAG: peptidase M10A and M12B matrixin and adamalysin [Methylomonas sp.]PPD54754.1 MAG: peptidase M10A and M12B matrixin and adamalysin [Methylomonas sp.]
MEKTQRLLAAGILLGLSSHSAQAVVFDIDYSYDSHNFFADPLRRDIFQAAANFFEIHLSDELRAITSSGVNRYDAIFSRPDTGVSMTLNNFSVAANTLTLFVGGQNLGGATLGLGGPGGYSVSGTTSFLNNAISRGQGNGTQGVVEGSGAYDFAPWGGSVSFNTASHWYFDNDVSTNEAFSGSDFFSVALHEIGHALGFGIADSWENQIIAGAFAGANSASLFGGNVPLSGDHVHWAEGTQINGWETAFDPTLTNGTRKRLTQLDLAALQDIGWQVTPIPLPGAVWLFASALLGLMGVSRKRNSVAAS